MSFNFEALNKGSKSTIKEGINTKEMSFVGLKEYVGKEMSFVGLKEYVGKEIKPDGFFFTDKGKYGRQVVVVADGVKINIPKRYVETFEGIRDNAEALDDFLSGHVIMTNIRDIDSDNGKTVCFDFKNV